ncbi:MAG: NfeD family protein [Planctomycetota bacterium]|jgi:membrane-bound ClpP family serine protease
MEVGVVLFCILLAWALLLAEPVLPSFGLLTITGLLLAGYGCYTAFSMDTLFGWCTLSVAVAGAPFAYYLGFRILQRTPMVLDTACEPPVPEKAPDGPRVSIGTAGVAVSALRPMGMVEFDGQGWEVHSQGGIIEAGVRVEVCGIRGKVIEVTPLDV